MNVESDIGNGNANLLNANDFGKLKPFCSDASIRYLENSLRNLEKGRPATPSFPLHGKRDVSIVDDVMRLIGKADIPEWLIEYEHSRISKFGPQGGYAPWKELLPNFLLYKTKCREVKYIDAEIIHALQQKYKTLRAQELGAREVLQHLIRTDKVETRAAGWNEFQLKKTDPEAQRTALRFALNGNWKHGYGYVFSRYNKLKPRIFMPMPFSSMIVQAKWFVPFLSGIQKSLLIDGMHSPFALWADKIGFDGCFDLMERELNSARLASDEYIVYFSNDFEKMDTRTGKSQYEQMFLPMMHAAFGGTAMDEAMVFTTTAPIISPSGTMTGSHGTASGAEVTNGGETVCGDYFQTRLLKLLSFKLKELFRVVAQRQNGDDSVIVFFVKKSCSFESFQDQLRECLAQVAEETQFDVQLEKLEISTVFGKYCQNVFQYNPDNGTLFWCYPLILVTNSIVNPEKEYTPGQWDKDYRDIDIVEKTDNARNHPAFHAYLDWVMAGTKYPLLGRSESETQRILSKYDKYRALQSLGERFNRQDYNISSSPSVKYILSKR